MPSKQEILKKKNYNQLKQMAEDRGISVSSDMEISKLINLVEENYSKEEIEAWPQLDIDKIESSKIEATEKDDSKDIEMIEKGSIKEKSKEVDRKISTEDLDVEERETVQRDPVFILAVFGAATAIILAILLLFFGI